ncbi:hypothetical protein AB1285_19980 [Microbacterium sp. NRRL B-14842]|uniref:hypothetical protein n=1 Tax=Microbacterium sp. NRRL B-14842 TaxID=3162881 RepID=UPI003D290596
MVDDRRGGLGGADDGGEPGSVEGGGHRDDDEVIPQLPHLREQADEEVGLEGTLVAPHR